MAEFITEREKFCRQMFRQAKALGFKTIELNLQTNSWSYEIEGKVRDDED